MRIRTVMVPSATKKVSTAVNTMLKVIGAPLALTASLVDRRLLAASAWAAAAAALSAFGVIHSPFADGRLFLPWAIGTLPPEAVGRGPLELAAAYMLVAILFAVWHAWIGREVPKHEA